jgi:ribosomal protein S18 acetylase RimI-like enzyme
MAIGEGTVTERDKVAANYDAATIEMLRIRLRAGQSVLAAASGPNGPLAAGSYQLAGGVAEITGVGVLPASRRRGLAAAVTHALAEDALARGASLVFLSATDATVARIYARLGFREIGTAMIAEPPELAGLLAWAAQLVQRRGRAPGQRPALAGEVRLVGVAGPDRRVRQVDRSGRSVD